jgi:tetratricopeptide (TPR) repeat protein
VLDYPDEYSYQDGLVDNYVSLAYLLGKSGGSLNDREKLARQAFHYGVRLAQQFPHIPHHSECQALVAGNLGWLLMLRGKLEESDGLCREAVEIMRELVREFPSVPRHRRLLASYLGNWGEVRRLMGRLQQAEDVLQEARQLQENLVEEGPRMPEYRQELAFTWMSLGRVLTDASRQLEATAAFGKARDNLEKVITECPDMTEYQNDLAWLLLVCPCEGIRDASTALGLALRMVELAPRQSEYWKSLGVAYYRLGRWREAVDALDNSMEIRPAGDGYTLVFMAMAHWKLGQEETAHKLYSRAVEWTGRNAPVDDILHRFRLEATQLLQQPDTLDRDTGSHVDRDAAPPSDQE